MYACLCVWMYVCTSFEILINHVKASAKEVGPPINHDMTKRMTTPHKTDKPPV